jgi:hypothetical protein
LRVYGGCGCCEWNDSEQNVKTPESESEVRVGDLGSTIHRSAHRHMGDRTKQWYKQARREERAYRYESCCNQICFTPGFPEMEIADMRLSSKIRVERLGSAISSIAAEPWGSYGPGDKFYCRGAVGWRKCSIIPGEAGKSVGIFRRDTQTMI